MVSTDFGEGTRSPDRAATRVLTYALMCRSRSPEDARDTFKALRSQHIAEQSALLYCEWASLEAGAGNTQQATSVLKKAMRAGAKPTECVDRHAPCFAPGC
jgi:lipopolysaccharide biosynthesis regulator YciM